MNLTLIQNTRRQNALRKSGNKNFKRLRVKIARQAKVYYLYQINDIVN